MSIRPQILCPETVLGITAATLATGPSGGWALVKRAVFTAYSGNAGNVTITVYRVISGDSAVQGNVVIDTMTLTPGQAYTAPELANMVLNDGDTIQALCSSASAVNATISGFTGP